MPAVWTQQQITNNLLRSNTFWSGPNITFSFPTSDPGWEVSAFGTTASGFSALSAAQKAAAVIAIGLWDELIAPTVTQTTGGGDITLQNYKVSAANDPTNTHGYYAGTFTSAYISTPYNKLSSAAVFFNNKYDSTTGSNDLVTPKIGAWGFNSYMHELGHAFGLLHPGTYNGGSPTYAADAAYTHDTIEYSIMSYFSASNTGADWQAADGKFYYPQTPMIDDVAAMQAIYGADITTRTGNTTYGFHSTLANVDGGIFDFTQNKNPVLMIWDATGNDTLDLSGFTGNSRIDLQAGASSDCDGMTNNIWIANNCLIENAVGGTGSDVLLGNSAANILNGGLDALVDTLIGGLGNDTYIINTATDNITELVGGSTADHAKASVSFVLAVGDNIEFLETTTAAGIGAINLTGNEIAQTITGNAGANILNGGLDALVDTLIGGLGNDTYIINTATDNITELVGGGMADHAKASVSFVLQAGDNIEFLETTNAAGVGAINLTGNEIVQTITGNAGANILNGGLANDTLTGGTGADTFRFTDLHFGGDTITDFQHGVDMLSFGSTVAQIFSEFTIVGNGTSNVTIFHGTDSIILTEVTPITIDAQDFLFV